MRTPAIILLTNYLPLLAETASGSHVCERTLRDLVKSAAKPHLKTLKELAVYMGVSISSLLNLESPHGFDLYTVDPQDTMISHCGEGRTQAKPHITHVGVWN